MFGQKLRKEDICWKILDRPEGNITINREKKRLKERELDSSGSA
jgi:hypothetical protein